MLFVYPTSRPHKPHRHTTFLQTEIPLNPGRDPDTGRPRAANSTTPQWPTTRRDQKHMTSYLHTDPLTVAPPLEPPPANNATFFEAKNPISATMSIPPQVQQYLSKIDRQFQGHGYLDQFEHATGLPRSTAVLGFGAVYVIAVFLNIAGLGQLLTNIAGFVLPAYYSLIALKTSRTDDDTQLLTYWVIFAFLNVIEFWLKAILYWVPFYFVFKLVFLLYIGTPSTGGAQVVYQHLVGPVGDQILAATKGRTPNINAAAESVSGKVHVN